MLIIVLVLLIVGFSALALLATSMVFRGYVVRRVETQQGL